MFEIRLDEVPFLKLEQNWQAIANTAFRRLSEDVVKEAKLNIDPSRSGLHNRSGRLRDSIRLRKFYQLTPFGDAEAVIGAGNASVPYARIHELGGTIKAKNSEYLTFKIGSRWFKKKQVTIPARPYLKTAAEAKQREYSEYLSDAIASIVEKL